MARGRFSSEGHRRSRHRGRVSRLPTPRAKDAPNRPARIIRTGSAPLPARPRRQQSDCRSLRWPPLPHVETRVTHQCGEHTQSWRRYASPHSRKGSNSADRLLAAPNSSNTLLDPIRPTHRETGLQTQCRCTPAFRQPGAVPAPYHHNNKRIARMGPYRSHVDQLRNSLNGTTPWIAGVSSNEAGAPGGCSLALS